jgi:hypothetical protein
VIREPEVTPSAPEQPNQAPRDQPSPCCASIDRRRETRYATNDPVEIQLLEAGGGPRVGGKVLDVSRSGLRLELPTPIGKALRIQIVLADRTIIFGETRYCRHLSPFYHVGVAIESVCYGESVIADHLRDTELNLYPLGQGLTAAQAIHVKNHLLSCGSCRDRITKAQALRRSCLREK